MGLFSDKTRMIQADIIRNGEVVDNSVFPFNPNPGDCLYDKYKVLSVETVGDKIKVHVEDLKMSVINP